MHASIHLVNTRWPLLRGSDKLQARGQLAVSRDGGLGHRQTGPSDDSSAKVIRQGHPSRSSAKVRVVTPEEWGAGTEQESSTLTLASPVPAPQLARHRCSSVCSPSAQRHRDHVPGCRDELPSEGGRTMSGRCAGLRPHLPGGTALGLSSRPGSSLLRRAGKPRF